MSKHSDSPNTPHSDEHGTTSSYIIGFLLSLVFTFIPYYIVVNKSLQGSTLLATILGVGVLQMIIQIVFFLHLGRGPKPLYNVVFFLFTATTILVVVGGSIFIMNNLHYNMAPSDVAKKIIEKEGIYQVGDKKTGACQGVHDIHKVTITNGKVSPVHTEAHVCDRLTFINEDDEAREMTFGTHPAHDSYAGENELQVRKGRAKTIILSEAGTYQFHDHLDPTINGHFTVSADDDDQN